MENLIVGKENQGNIVAEPVFQTSKASYRIAETDEDWMERVEVLTRTDHLQYEATARRAVLDMIADAVFKSQNQIAPVVKKIPMKSGLLAPKSHTTSFTKIIPEIVDIENDENVPVEDNMAVFEQPKEKEEEKSHEILPVVASSSCNSTQVEKKKDQQSITIEILNQEIADLTKSLEHERSNNSELKKVVEQYAEALSDAISASRSQEIEKEEEKEDSHDVKDMEDRVRIAEKERDEALRSRGEVGNLFEELRARYRTLKTTHEKQQRNEKILKERTKTAEMQLQTTESRYLQLKQRTEEKLKMAKQAHDDLSKSRESDVALLEAKVKKAEARAVQSEQSLTAQHAEIQSLRVSAEQKDLLESKVKRLEMQVKQSEETIAAKVQENTEVMAICDDLMAKFEGQS